MSEPMYCGDFVVWCELCDAHSQQHDTREAADWAASDAGWTVRKGPYGAYEFICPNCRHLTDTLPYIPSFRRPARVSGDEP